MGAVEVARAACGNFLGVGWGMDGVILRDYFTQTNVAYGIIITGFYCQSELEIKWTTKLYNRWIKMVSERFYACDELHRENGDRARKINIYDDEVVTTLCMFVY